MKRFRSLFLRQILQAFPVGHVLAVFRKIDIVKDRLNIKACSAGKNRNMTVPVNGLHGLFHQLLKKDHMKFILRVQHIDEMMGNALHLIRSDLGGTDIHPSVYLHRIRGDNLAADGFG